MSGRLTLLLTSPRVAPGLLARQAWQVLEQADVVLCADVDDPQPEAIAQAGVAVRAAPAAQPELARELVATAGGADVVWVGSPDADPGLTDALAGELSLVAGRADPPQVEVLVGSHDVPGARLLDLVAVMDRLRSPGGCPWDAEQTHASLAPYLLEEAFETVEAIETRDAAGLREELGDVLLQVVFHARVAAERDPSADGFDVDDVADGIVRKLVTRHPHVFAAVPEADAATADSVAEGWEAIKAREKQRAHVLDGIPLALPALARADKVLGRLERTGAVAVQPPDGLGAELLAMVARARAEGVDAEAALREAVRAVEHGARSPGAA